MGHPDLSSTMLGRRTVRGAPHQHCLVARDGPTEEPAATLVALAMAVQDDCQACVQHHAAAARRLQASRLKVLEALATALLLSTPHADRWPRLAEAALTAHERGRS